MGSLLQIAYGRTAADLSVRGSSDSEAVHQRFYGGNMDALFSKIIRSDEHSHYIIDPSDKDAFVAAGFAVCGTVTEDLQVYLRVRQLGDHERKVENNLLYPSPRQEYQSYSANRVGVGQVEVDVTSETGDAGGSEEKVDRTPTSDADAGVSNSGDGRGGYPVLGGSDEIGERVDRGVDESTSRESVAPLAPQTVAGETTVGTPEPIADGGDVISDADAVTPEPATQG